jgi:photosystem II stability/assembly factor-like uncharacterized protein
MVVGFIRSGKNTKFSGLHFIFFILLDSDIYRHFINKKHMTSKLFILMAFLATPLSGLWAQDYLEMMQSDSYTVSQVVAEAEAYFALNDKGQGSGYVPFKRWEYMANRLKDQEGYLPNTLDRMNVLAQYNAYLNETGSSRASLFDNWEELGPKSWNATTHWSPGVGRVTGLSVQAGNEQHMIIGAETGGVWRTFNGGTTWEPLSDYLTNLRVYAVTIDPSDPEVYYFGSTAGLIYKSQDAGATWFLHGQAGSSVINKILIHPTNSQIMFASGEYHGIYRSIDGGYTWDPKIQGENRGYDIEFKPGNSDVVYASGNRLHVSQDGGDNFVTHPDFNNVQPIMIGICASAPETVYVVQANNGSFGGLYKSIDSGETFTDLGHSGRNYFGYDTSGFNSGGQAPRDMDITVNPSNVDEVHIAGVLTWKSNDGGVNFDCTSDWIPGNAQSAGLGYCHADVDLLEFVNETLYVGSDGGLFKATDTETISADYYTDLSTGLGIRQFYKIGVTQTPEVVVTGGSQDNGSSFYSATTEQWIDWIGADGMEGFVDKDNPNLIYGMIQFGGMYRTENAGATLLNLPEPGSGSGEWVSPFEQDPSVQNTIYSAFERVFKSTNKGGNWLPISQDFGADLTHLKIAASDNQIMYAARGPQFYRTMDGGTTDWILMSPPGGTINSIAIHPSDPMRIAVAVNSSAKVRISNDGGATWSTHLFNLPNFSALALVWDDNGDNGLYLGMDYGIYYIDDMFSEWQPFNTNLPNVIVNELEINQANGKIYAGTYGRGLWASTKYGYVVGIEDQLSSQSVRVYPNPAKSVLHIAYSGQLKVNLQVFDLQGKLLISQPQIWLDQNLTIPVGQLSPGVYFMRLTSAKGVMTQKFIKK